MSPKTIVFRLLLSFGLVFASLLPVAFAAAPFGRYQLTEDTVLDVKTRLMWQRRSTQSSRWSGCLDYCENLDLAGRVDWRLANVREFITIIDHGASPPLDSSAFNGEPFGSLGYWTSSVVQTANRSIYFSSTGQRSEDNNWSNRYCRCVRGPDPVTP